MIQAVIFDYGGVVLPLIEHLDLIANAYAVSPQTLKPALMPFVEQLSRGEISEPQFWSLVSTALHRPIPHDALTLWTQRSSEWSINWPIIHLIKLLKQRGLITVVLSNIIPPHAANTRANGGYQFFDHVFLSCEVGLRKPDPAIYHYVLDKLVLKGHDCLYIDDVPGNLPPAQMQGMRTLLAENPLQVVRDVHSLLKM